MRKLAILAILAVPVSALGAYALAASDDPTAPDSRMTVNETEKGNLATSDQATQRFAMEDSDEEKTEAGPLRPDGLNLGDTDDEEEHEDH